MKFCTFILFIFCAVSSSQFGHHHNHNHNRLCWFGGRKTVPNTAKCLTPISFFHIVNGIKPFLVVGIVEPLVYFYGAHFQEHKNSLEMHKCVLFTLFLRITGHFENFVCCSTLCPCPFTGISTEKKCVGEKEHFEIYVVVSPSSLFFSFSFSSSSSNAHSNQTTRFSTCKSLVSFISIRFSFVRRAFLSARPSIITSMFCTHLQFRILNKICTANGWEDK